MFKSPIIVIGAPRSGTKMLRELLKVHPKIDGALYEKERIWCYNNTDRINRSLTQEQLSPETADFIRDHYQQELFKSGCKWVVDKSVANTLRVKYIRRLFPQSPIIHIVRDGRDAVCSAIKRWEKPADYQYILRNRAFPIVEIPFFLKRQLKWKIEKMTNGTEHVKWWGPQFDDKDKLVDKYSLIELCGIQWSRCVEAALSGLQSQDEKSYLTVRYENIVTQPIEAMRQVFHFLRLNISSKMREKTGKYVSISSLERWKQDLSKEDLNNLYHQIGSTLVKLGYNFRMDG